MNNDVDNMVKRLNFENLIWVAFIIISALDIYGDELLKKEVLYHDQKAKEKANKLFLGLSAFSILIYIYFFIRNYNDYKKYHNKSYEIRLIGSTLILAGTLCLLYFQLTTTNSTNSQSNV